ncbi:MAG: S8 family serine peptidase, partial [Acidobacteria bacterium]|nr:S8 family serine peptidase [Acidobacteriota bacterium]
MLLLPLGSAWGQRLERGRAVRMLARPHVAAQFIVKFRDAEQAPESDSVGAYATGGVRELSRLGTSGLHLVRTGRGGAEVLEQLSQHPDVEYVEPDYILTASKFPNDPLFANLWGLRNTVLSGADISATLAWDITTGSKGVMVGIIDTGVDFTHPDLTANVWTAPRAFTVTVGGSQTVTCAAGTRGFNAITKACVPMDDNGHGTHVAGTIAGAGNNGSGVTGINWTGAVLPLKFLDASGSGSTSNAILAIDFAVQLKQQFPTEGVLKNGGGGGGSSQALETAIGQANTAGMLFVAAAGNEAANNDTTGSFPANSEQANVISVASTDQLDGLSSFSNYGLKVHLAAPGSKIVSTFLNGQYATMSGTSMATPHVAGAAALVLSACGSLDTAGLKRVLLQTVDPLNVLTGKTSSGGRLNVYKAVRQCATPGVTLEASPSSRMLKAGETTTFTLTPRSLGGVTGTPTVQMTGLPTGVTATVSGVMAFGTGSTLSVVTAGTVTPGTYALTATLAMESLRATTALTLVVQAATVTAPFTLAATPGGMDVVRGASSALTVRIARASGFTGPVTVVVEGLSVGLTGTPLTIASGATTGTVTLAATATATLGTANVRVVGTGGSPVGSVTAPVIVTVRVPVAPFSMTAPGALQVSPGGNGTVVVTIVRSAGFTGPVTV